jgi:hypothetical protein
MHRNASSLLATIMHSFLLGKRWASPGGQNHRSPGPQPSDAVVINHLDLSLSLTSSLSLHVASRAQKQN